MDIPTNFAADNRYRTVEFVRSRTAFFRPTIDEDGCIGVTFCNVIRALVICRVTPDIRIAKARVVKPGVAIATCVAAFDDTCLRVSSRAAVEVKAVMTATGHAVSEYRSVR